VPYRPIPWDDLDPFWLFFEKDALIYSSSAVRPQATSSHGHRLSRLRRPSARPRPFLVDQNGCKNGLERPAIHVFPQTLVCLKPLVASHIRQKRCGEMMLFRTLPALLRASAETAQEWVCFAFVFFFFGNALAHRVKSIAFSVQPCVSARDRKHTSFLPRIIRHETKPAAVARQLECRCPLRPPRSKPIFVRADSTSF